MRIRGTKPEFWRSKRIASVSWDARLVLKALESYVDDNGVGEDDVNVIVGDCFLHDLIREPSRTLARVSEAISELETTGLMWRYGANGKRLLFISFWETVQRVDKPQPGRNPRPDGTMNYKDSVIRESNGSPREASRTLAPVTGEQGNRGTEEQGGSRDETSPPTPTCRRHPDGTDSPCAACKKARQDWEATQPKKTTPIPARITDTSGMCDIHSGYPLPCHRCENESEAA
jgi:hypothetical protein